MSRAEFQKSVRMFHKFSEETLRRRGGNQAGRESVVALAAIEAVLRGERLFDAALLEPLAAFTNLLQSGQLPPEFGDYSFGDALLAIEAAHAEQRQAAPQRWEFEPELGPAALPSGAFALEPATSSGGEHASKLRRFVLDAARAAAPGAVLVSGALSSADLPLVELAQRFERVVLADLDLGALEALVRRAVPEEQRGRFQLERYDVTGCRAAFSRAVDEVVQAAPDAARAVVELTALLASYDVGSGSAGISAVVERPELAISAMQLASLGAGFEARLSSALAARGFDGADSLSAPLELFARLLEQHHVQALLRRAQSAVLVSAVSEVELRGAGGAEQAASEPRDLLGVERLAERLPESATLKSELSWEWRRAHPSVPGASLLTLVEAVLV